jgi:nitrogen regulatory protein PII
MKAIFIIYNQAHTEKVEYMLDMLNIRGFTQWTNVSGRGSENGVPHMGSHTWPEMNSAIISVVDDTLVDTVLDKVQKINAINEEVGIRAFVWEVLKSV